MFQEHLGTIGDILDPTYSEPIVKRWNAKLSSADAFLVVTAEYLHSIECEAAPLRNAVLIPHVGAAFDDAGYPRDPMTTAALTITLDDLAWWSGALATARAAGSLPPGNARIRAAMARLAAPTP